MGTQRVLKGIASILARLAAGLLLPILILEPAAADPPILMGYYESWSEQPGTAAAATRLANLPKGLDILALGFARPDMNFDGGNDLAGTGLEMPFDATVATAALALFRERNPQTRVLLSIGGAAYDRWNRYEPEAAARLIARLGLDGIDLDHEPKDPGCRPLPENKGISCDSDAAWIEIVRRTRSVLPRPAMIAAQAWSVGAYGAGRFAEATPNASHTGSMLWLKHSAAAREIDVLAIMAYGAGRRFDPLTAFDAYREIWPGRLLLGARIGGIGGGGPPATTSILQRYADRMARDPLGGMMLYTLVAGTSHRSSRVTLDGQAAVSVVCRSWGREDCTGTAR